MKWAGIYYALQIYQASPVTWLFNMTVYNSLEGCCGCSSQAKIMTGVHFSVG